MNELLMSKILRNPCLQKILDPNTKLFSQNGREIQRQPNTAATPSVIKNYFIVPPEFFNLSANKTEEKSTNVPRNRKAGNRRANLTKTKTKLNVTEDIEQNNRTKNDDQGKRKDDHKREKKKKNKRKPAKLTEDKTEINVIKENKEPKRDVKITKKRKKQESSVNAKSRIKTSSSSEDTKVEKHKHESDKPYVENNTSKRRKKARKESDDIKNYTEDHIPTPEIVEGHENISPEINKIKFASEPSKLEIVPETEDGSHLKDIENPIENSETKNLKENSRPTKSTKENGRTRKTNTDKVKKEPKDINKQAQSITPISEDMLKNFFPYMYMGNNFYSNGNYPFNFEQFYQPYVGGNNRKNNKTRKNQSESNKKDSLPNVYEVKLKPKKSQNTTAIKPLNEENTNKTKLSSTNTTSIVKPMNEKNTDLSKLVPAVIKTTPVSDENITNIPVKELNDEKLTETLKKEKLEPNPKPDLPKPEFVVTKANLEMPPTVIEDLHEYITPELGNEDIVPTIHTNGIINDYYPTFYSDSHYTNDENYYLRDLEDDRHFYTTDRGLEEPLNRDRRKYDKHEEYPRLNLDIKDRINYRRTYKFRENEKAKFDDYDKSFVRRPIPDKIIEKENVIQDINSEKDVKPDISLEDIFQSPPLLENPDFKTSKIEKSNQKSDVESYIRQPIYTDSVELLTDHKLHSDPQPMQFSRLVNFDGDVTNNDKISTKKPRGDRIETVFAKTRVVKYGVAKEEEENTSALPLFENNGEDLYGDGHTTYVLAKSLGHSDDYFW